MDDRRGPFPGMDPWLERAWNEVHHSLIERLADQIADGLPSGLVVHVEERVYVVDPVEDPWPFVPDGGVFATGRAGRATQAADGGVAAVAEPVELISHDEPVTEGFIEIRRVEDGRPLVTAIEVLSRANKCSAGGRREYRRKRRHYRRAGVNLVELDLLRCCGEMADTGGRARPTWASAYQCVVRRYNATGRSSVYLYPILLRERLPRIGVPLRPDDRDVVVDLQPPVDHVYRRGQYADGLNYFVPPVPPLSADDAAWGAERIDAWHAARLNDHGDR